MYDRLLVRVVVRLEVVIEPFVEVIAHGSSSPELEGVLESHDNQANVLGSLYSSSCRDVREMKSDVRRLVRPCVRRVQSVVGRETVRQDDSCFLLGILVANSLEGNLHASRICL